MRSTLLFAGSILLIETLWLPPVLSTFLFIAALLLAPFKFGYLYLKKQRDRIAFDFKILIILAILPALSWAIFLTGLENAKDKASIIVKACEEYREEKGRFPEKLEELVPDFYSAPIPQGFRYVKPHESIPPLLLFPPRYYRYSYDFQTDKWGVLD